MCTSLFKLVTKYHRLSLNQNTFIFHSSGTGMSKINGGQFISCLPKALFLVCKEVFLVKKEILFLLLFL